MQLQGLQFILSFSAVSSIAYNPSGLEPGSLASGTPRTPLSCPRPALQGLGSRCPSGRGGEHRHPSPPCQSTGTLAENSHSILSLLLPSGDHHGGALPHRTVHHLWHGGIAVPLLTHYNCQVFCYSPQPDCKTGLLKVPTML